MDGGSPPGLYQRPIQSCWWMELHLCSVLLGHVRQPGICHDSPIHKFHNVEGCAHPVGILAQTIGLGHRYCRVFESMDYAIFPLDLVGSLGEEWPGRLLAHDISLAIGRSELVCWVRLTEAELDQSTRMDVRSVILLILGAFTCLTSSGVLISGTFFSMYLWSADMSIGWRISPAIFAVQDMERM